ncbi:SDR family NAD(P)-dependent oxidoreductase [Glaciihabitans sp. UYNi722]|uniref:SDR family NAD(P)-dependent oxidoreductase n=1 Tax=Glaciihabitans sp. UYNi722 TaxID=3156344 RepID=UPI003392B454
MTAPAPLEGQVAVVTGATGGMGQVIARTLARSGAHVITVARDPHRADTLRDQIANDPGPGQLDVITGDLSHTNGLIASATAITAQHDAIHILINNAGAHFTRHRLSADGLEMHIAVDYFPAFAMTSLLEEALRRGKARVVNIASDTIRDTRQVKLLGRPRPATIDPRDLDDLTRLNTAAGFVPFEAYARAKLLTVIAGYDQAHTLGTDGVTVNAVHPGIVATDIVDDLIPPILRPVGSLIRRFMLTPEQGAAAALRLATDESLAGISGRYFVRDIEVTTPTVSYDTTIQQQLRDSSRRFLTGA